MVTYMQADVMTLSIFSIRARPYLALIHNLRQECKRRGQLSYFLRKLQRYLDQQPADGNLFSDEDKKDIIALARSLEWCGLDAEDWWGDYYNRFIDLSKYISLTGDKKEDNNTFYKLQMKLANDCIKAMF